uniref:Uncharacterized protein n=1 Tax=viral metagenome TaxID=1070528 RepID=A0A6C0DAP2_9ZZZZ
MDKYTNQIEESTLVINNTYKITTKKGDILAKFVGRNKNEGLHFVLETNKHTVVINPSDIIAIYEL